MNQQLEERLTAELGFTAERVSVLRKTPFEQAVSQLEAMKQEARGAYRKLVFKYHPDRNAGDETMIRALTRVLENLESLQIRRKQPQPPPMVVHFNQGVPINIHIRRAPTYSTTTTASVATVYNATFVTNIRPV